MKNKFIIKLLLFISIIILLNSIKMIFRERIILNVNNDNKDYIYTILEEETDDIESVSKVAYGGFWLDHFIYVYRPFQETEELLLTEGYFSRGDLADYIRDNGYNEKYIGIITGIISSMSIVLCSIKLRKTNKKIMNKNETF